MDVSDLRRRILRALDEAQKAQATRRVAQDEAAKAYERFLAHVAVPIARQAATVMNAAHYGVIVHTPSSGVRIASEASPETYVELALDTTASPPQVVGRVSVGRGRQDVIVEEHPIAPAKAIDAMTEDDVSAFFVRALPKLVVRP